jgi:SNF2 family DNA or RNA helicase
LIDNNPSDAEWIGKAVSPLILRRKVKDLENQLPPLIEIEQPLEVNQEFAIAYESVRKGLISATSQMVGIARVTKLRQFCCYPPIVDREFDTSNNPKLDRLIEILDEIHSMKSDQVIIFTSYSDSINVLLHEIKGRYGDVFVEPIDGRFDSDKRDQIVQKFQNLNRFGVLVINPQAGGQGLNIPAANHVIHYNLEWNPAKEQQATARAWRTGQKKTVFVHRMFYLGTVEEVIYDRLKLKSDIAQSALKPSEIEKEDKDVNRALAISPIF